jgi:hypothetical protein
LDFSPSKQLGLKSKLRILFLLCTFPSFGGTLRIDLSHQFANQPLTLNSLKYESTEILSISRLSYLLSEFAVQNQNGTWQDLPDQFAYLDASSRRSSFTLSELPSGTYKSLRFSVGVPKRENHSDPAQHPADHPLNPNLNKLHWDWATGYIFLALEGQFRTSEKNLNGFVYHLANDQNLSRVQLAANFRIKNNTALALTFDLQKLLSQPRAISFEKDGNSTHSHPGDPIASALVANLQSAFSVRGVSYPPHEVPLAAVTPLYLPEKYTPFPFKMSRRFPMPLLPRDNPLISERVALGKQLFHDKSLSKDGTISCATCHHQDKAFTDALPLSKGINAQVGDRNSMPLFNLVWKSSFFWDGRAKSLRDQVLQPIEDHREMASNIKAVVAHLQKTELPAFEKAFGSGPVTEQKIALALENFLLTLTSYDSKFDRAMSGKNQLTEAEKRSMELFFTEYEPRSITRNRIINPFVFDHPLILHGAAVYARSSLFSELNLDQVTVAHNHCHGVVDWRGRTTLTHCTITLNRGRGFHDFEGSRTKIFSSIITENTEDLEIDPATVAGDKLSLLDGPADLLPLGFYGGLTETMPPRAGSPVVDAGGTSDTESDQRDLPRSHRSNPDLGAVEYQGETLEWIAGFDADSDQDGVANGLESALGREPFVFESAPVLAFRNSKGALQLVFPKPSPSFAQFVSIQVLQSSDLSTTFTEILSNRNTPFEPNGSQIQIPLPLNRRGFFHLEATLK